MASCVLHDIPKLSIFNYYTRDKIQSHKTTNSKISQVFNCYWVTFVKNIRPCPGR